MNISNFLPPVGSPIAAAVPALAFLFCRFDLREKTWHLPKPRLSVSRESLPPIGPALLAAAVSHDFPAFSDPATGGNTHPGTTHRRIRFRRSALRSGGKPTNPKK